MTRDQMLEHLRTAAYCKVKFVKADGSIRTMHCTLNLEGEEGIQPTFSSNPQANPTSITVWDLEKQAWRQFKVDSVIDFVAEVA